MNRLLLAELLEMLKTKKGLTVDREKHKKFGL